MAGVVRPCVAVSGKLFVGRGLVREVYIEVWQAWIGAAWKDESGRGKAGVVNE